MGIFNYLSSDYYFTHIKMLLAVSNIHACLLVPQPNLLYPERAIKTLELPVEAYDHVLTLVANDGNLRSQMVDVFPHNTSLQCVVYCKETQIPKRESMTANQFVSSAERVLYLNVSHLDIPLLKLTVSSQLASVRCLDLSRLRLEDKRFIEFLEAGRLTNLRRLDLSGNPGITSSSVSAICGAVAAGRLPNLNCLELNGTECDASPYIDGHYWRISEAARQLASEFGFQRWMMLGSRIPELSNSELLTLEQRYPEFG
jgi:hypothetical protein